MSLLASMNERQAKTGRSNSAKGTASTAFRSMNHVAGVRFFTTTETYRGAMPGTEQHWMPL